MISDIDELFSTAIEQPILFISNIIISNKKLFFQVVKSIIKQRSNRLKQQEVLLITVYIFRKSSSDLCSLIFLSICH